MCNHKYFSRVLPLWGKLFLLVILLPTYSPYGAFEELLYILSFRQQQIFVKVMNGEIAAFAPQGL